MTVLVVDDDPAMLLLLKRLLTSTGYEVLTATDGAQALQLVRDQRISIVVSDWMMPGTDGLDLCQAIRADRSLSYVYVLLLTANSDRDNVVRALDAGVDDYLTKPVDRTELLARLRGGERVVRLEADLAQRHRMEDERDHLRKALSALEQVLGVVAHELRTPLAGVRAMTELLLGADARDTAEFDTFLRSIHDEVVKMAATVNNTLEVARMNSGTAQWNWARVNVAEVCRQAMETIRPLVDQSQVTLRLEVEPPDLAMRGDPGAIRRLVVNLLSNATKHTSQGSITVRAAAQTIEHRPRVRLDVEDTGEGMPPGIASRLGVAFALNSGIVGESHVRGTGLGLAICKGIVAVHGGHIRVRTSPGEGTTISIDLPTDQSEPAPTEQAGDIAWETTP